MQTAPKSQGHSQDGCFQSTQKQQTIQILNFIPLKAFSNQAIKSRRNEEDIIWKIKTNDCSLAGKKWNYKFSKNISFEDGERYSSSDEESEEEQEPQISPLAHYYKSHEEVFHKRINFGTSWIGRKQYFASTFINPANLEKGNTQYYFQKQTDESSKIYNFDSNFESGNLLSVYKVSPNEYDLLLQNDINTKGNTQWFYFRLSNPPKNVNIKINIVNMRKSDSLFNYGMMPCIYSQQEQRRSKKGWFRGGKNIKYLKNDHQIENSRRCYYTLTFTISTPYDNDILKIAQTFPYTYSDLNAYLDNNERIKYKKELFQRQIVLNTIGKNRIEAITIKQPNSRVKLRPFIIVIARQHPGETPGSFICEGLIDFLLSKQRQSQFLRKNYEIKVIPMINPDGVCAGNYRTNLYGYDLNRRWEGSKLKNLHEAALIKRYIAQIAKGRDIAFILDLHGHSRKMFSFFYGNPNPNNPMDVRIFPLLCSKLNNNWIKFEDSTFTSQEYKRNTARIQFGLSFKCLNIFTFEASFFGYYGKDKERRHFTIEDYKQLGAILGKGIYLHERGKQLYDFSPDHKEIILYKKCIGELRNNMILISLGEKANSGSESSPEQCQLKQSEGQRLEESEDYSKDNLSPPKTIKIIKKAVKKQLKWPTRSQRQMQVLDIAQVNSMLPNNVLALIPNSFLIKKKKVQTYSKLVQTDNTPLVKIYESCKQQEQKFHNPEIISSHLKSQTSKSEKITINMVKSSILGRPHSERQDHRERLFSAGFNKMGTRKFKQTKSTHKKVSSYGIHKGTVSRQTQTILSFNCISVNHLKQKLEKEISILEMKTIDPSFTSFNHSRHKQASFIGKNSSINMFQHLKIRKRNQI